MSECRKFREPMESLLSGEIRPDDLERLLAHTETCTECGRLFEMHHDLDDPRFALTEEDEVGLAAVRRAVIRQVRHIDVAAPASMVPGLPGVPTMIWWRPALAAGIATVLLGGGFLAGSALDRAKDPAEALVPRIEAAAVQARHLDESTDSPFSYSNVQVRDAGDGKVALSFEVSTHIDVVRKKNDPLVSEVLVQAMLQDQSMGTRLVAVDRASDLMDQRVRDALALAMIRDESLPVRLQALSRLTELSADPEVADAMLQVVEKEESVQMRLLAIDYLTENRVEPEALERAMDAGVPSQRYVVYARAQGYLGD